MTFLEKPSVQRVQKALPALGINEDIVEVGLATETVVQAAQELGVEPASIVRSRVFMAGKRFVVAYIAGDRDFIPDAIGAALNIDGKVSWPKGEFIRAVTNFPLGGVSPVSLPYDLPSVLDQSLKRHQDRLYIPAGHSRCMVPVTFEELKKLTGGIVSYAIAGPRTEKTNG